MARTQKKMELEELFSTASLAQLSEMDNVLSPFTFTPGMEDSLFGNNDDVYKDFIGKTETGDVGLAPEEFLAGELLDELDLKGGDGFGDAGWMTDKIDFSDLETTILTTQTKESIELDSNLRLETLDGSLAGIFVTASQSLTSNDDSVTNSQTFPESQEQKVPDVLPLSPDSGVSSPMSAASDDSFDNLDESATIAEFLLACESASTVKSDIVTCSNSDIVKTSSELQASQSIDTNVKKVRTAYMNTNATTYTVKPKIKTPQQRVRKREQNKDAATRYRVKKRDEHNNLLSECEDLEKVNKQLKDQVGSLSKEIDYLKNLMLEVYKTRLQKQQIEITA